MTNDQEIRVVRGNPTPEELAAIVSVIESMVAESNGIRARKAQRSEDSWVLSQRPIRTPIVRGITQWRSFS